MSMQRNRLFIFTRLKLAAWYAGVMGVILSLCGVAVYQMAVEQHWLSLDREVEAIAGTLHDGLEPVLQQPGQLNIEVHQLLPNLCLKEKPCPSTSEIYRVHTLGIAQQELYYVRFLDLSSRVIAIAGSPPQLPADIRTEWQILTDSENNRFHQRSLLLKNQEGQAWGYLQVGRSTRDYEAHVAEMKIQFLICLPLVMLIVGIASWFLSGLAMRPIHRSYRQMQQFTADAAHELQTPLAAIAANVETTIDTPDLSPFEAINTLKVVERQSHRLTQIVRDLLLLSRLDLQASPLPFKPCCLNDLVNDTVEEFAALAYTSGIKLRTEINTNQMIYVLGNEEQLYRLIANLVINAIYYTDQGGQITLRIRKQDKIAFVQVQDTGIGIDAKELPRIFDRFYRINPDRSRKTGGSGLGLAIAKAIARAHQGSLQAQSKPGQGSTFTLRLPLP